MGKLDATYVYADTSSFLKEPTTTRACPLQLLLALYMASCYANTFEMLIYSILQLV
jgi:hypothetical protein